MYFRVDMNNIIATGHVMRCLAMAEGFKDAGEECTFILADDFAKEFIESRGHSVIVLGTRWDDMDSEISSILDIVSKYNITKMIVDSYYVTYKYLEALNKCTSVAYIDDNNAFIYPVDMVIACGIWFDYSMYKEQYKNMNTRLLLGTKYVPLRKEFSLVKECNKDIDVMITTGGTDTYNVAGRLIDSIKINHPEWKVMVISSRLPKELETDNIKIKGNVTNMSEIMSASRVAISASGSTLYELCSCKIPTICFAFADNQLEFAAEMGRQGVMEYVGDARVKDDIIEQIVMATNNLLADFTRQMEVKQKMSGMIDGKGVERIVEEWLCKN